MQDLNFILVLSFVSIMIFLVSLIMFGWFKFRQSFKKPLTRVVVNSLIAVSLLFLCFFSLLFFASF